MTERLYYADAYTTEFTARVAERVVTGGRPAVVLDRTYFYAASGGQPADRGTIGGAAVEDVFAREGDAAVVHVLAREVLQDEVACRVDWPRRFDHMQQHTGQHILTQAFVQVAGAQTVGFHLSDDTVTIDLDMPQLAPAVVTEVEDLANRVIYEDRPVMARLVDQNAADGVRVRMMPDHLLTEGLRVIEIEGFDQTACGGTHVARTGEIGLIKIIKVEKRGDGLRVEFCCGGRALRDYRTKHAIISQLAADLTCSYREVGDALERLQADLKDAQRALRAATARLIELEAEHLLANAAALGGARLVKAAFDERDPGEVRALASRLVEAPAVIALLGTSGEKAQLFLARSADLPYDMNAALRQGLAVLGNARGGGRPDFAQGGGVPASSEQVQAALEAAGQVLRAAG
jgi:alanyl-tRNA synthetase